MNNFDKKVAEIAELTGYNDHTEALILGATLLGEDDIVEVVEKIKYNRDRIGYLSMEDYDKTSKQYKLMMVVAQETLTKENYKKFYQAF